MNINKTTVIIGFNICRHEVLLCVNYNLHKTIYVVLCKNPLTIHVATGS